LLDKEPVGSEKLKNVKVITSKMGKRGLKSCIEKICKQNKIDITLVFNAASKFNGSLRGCFKDFTSAGDNLIIEESAEKIKKMYPKGKSFFIFTKSDPQMCLIKKKK